MTLFNPYLLLLIAFILIILEFFLPGAVFGIFGAVFVVLSLIAFVLEGHPPLISLAYFIVVCTLVVFLVKYILKAIKRTGPKNTIMLDNDQFGYVASHFDKTLFGKQGIALTDLKPAGKVLVDDKEVSAMSELGYISRGLKIEVIGGKGYHLIVKRID